MFFFSFSFSRHAVAKIAGCCCLQRTSPMYRARCQSLSCGKTVPWCACTPSNLILFYYYFAIIPLLFTPSSRFGQVQKTRRPRVHQDGGRRGGHFEEDVLARVVGMPLSVVRRVRLAVSGQGLAGVPVPPGEAGVRGSRTPAGLGTADRSV